MAATKRVAKTSKPAKKVERPETDTRIERLKKLVGILESSSLSSLEYEDTDIAVKISRSYVGNGQAGPPLMAPIVTSLPTPQATTPPAPAKKEEEENVFVVKSPFVGTFYRSPSPDQPSFTEVGQQVVKGQTLCIVEAMKLMNEIESEVAGTVLAVLVENGQAVQYHDPLFKIAVA
jgi:acetyl-CoA carboxylase biotin carboxyl carrier protein